MAQPQHVALSDFSAGVLDPGFHDRTGAEQLVGALREGTDFVQTQAGELRHRPAIGPTPLDWQDWDRTAFTMIPIQDTDSSGIFVLIVFREENPNYPAPDPLHPTRYAIRVVNTLSGSVQRSQ